MIVICQCNCYSVWHLDTFSSEYLLDNFQLHDTNMTWMARPRNVNKTTTPRPRDLSWSTVSQSVSQSFATSKQSRPLYKALLFLVAKITLELSGRGYWVFISKFVTLFNIIIMTDVISESLDTSVYLIVLNWWALKIIFRKYILHFVLFFSLRILLNFHKCYLWLCFVNIIHELKNFLTFSVP